MLGPLQLVRRENIGLRVGLRVTVEVRDLWVGVYWLRYNEGWSKGLRLYVCLIPAVPLILDFLWGTPTDPRGWREVD